MDIYRNGDHADNNEYPIYRSFPFCGSGIFMYAFADASLDHEGTYAYDEDETVYQQQFTQG